MESWQSGALTTKSTSQTLNGEIAVGCICFKNDQGEKHFPSTLVPLTLLSHIDVYWLCDSYLNENFLLLFLWEFCNFISMKYKRFLDFLMNMPYIIKHVSVAGDQIIIFLLSLFSDCCKDFAFFFFFCNSSVSAIKISHTSPLFADDVETCIWLSLHVGCPLWRQLQGCLTRSAISLG